MLFDVNAAYEAVKRGEKLPCPALAPLPLRHEVTRPVFWFDVDAAYGALKRGEDISPCPDAEPIAPLTRTHAGLSHREQVIVNLVAKGRRCRGNGDTVTHALLDRLIERGCIIQSKGGRLRLAKVH